MHNCVSHDQSLALIIFFTILSVINRHVASVYACMSAPEFGDVGFRLSLCLCVRRQTVALHGSGQTRVIVMTVLVVVVVLATAI